MRALIGVERADGTVDAVLCTEHGEPHKMGEFLIRHYWSDWSGDDIDALTAHAALAVMGSVPALCTPVDDHAGVPGTLMSVGALENHALVHRVRALYLYKGGRWLASTGRINTGKGELAWRPLLDVLEDGEEVFNQALQPIRIELI